MESQKSFGMEIRSLNILILRKISGLIGISEAEGYATLMHGRIIEFLYLNRNKEIFQRDIEHGFEIRRPTVTKILQSMERRGLIKRQGVDYDARLKQVILTEKAFQIQEKMVEVLNRFESESIKGLTEGELKLFFKVIDKVKRNLDGI
jgi:DNA-binding MarR family transcriptional regulator